MRHFSPDSTDLTGGDSSAVPTGMESDPNADEEIINQQAGGRNRSGEPAAPPSSREQYPKPVGEPDQQTGSPKIAPDGLTDSIAYALDGSGPGLTNDTPNVSGHKVVTEGVTGAGPEDEEDAMHPE